MATNSAINLITAASGKLVQAQGVGVANGFTTATYPTTAGTSRTVLRSDGTNWVNSSAFKVSSADVYTNTAQPSVKAILSTTASDITGDGTIVTIPFDTASFDQASNFNTGTYRFTAPVTGKYWVFCNIYMAGLAAGHNSGKLFILSNNTNNIGQYIFNPGAIRDVNNTASVSMGQMIAFNASDYIEMRLVVYSGAKTVDVGNDNFGLLSWFDIQLMN